MINFAYPGQSRGFLFINKAINWQNFSNCLYLVDVFQVISNNTLLRRYNHNKCLDS